MIPGSGRSSGEGNGYPFQCSCLENFMERGLVGYCPWGHKELDMTERLSLSLLSLSSACQYHAQFWCFLCGSAGKESACNVGDLGFNPWVQKIPWRREWQPTLYSCLENSMDCIVYGAAKSQTQLSDFHFTKLFDFKK